MGSNGSLAAQRNKNRQHLTIVFLGTSITPRKQRPGPAVPQFTLLKPEFKSPLPRQAQCPLLWSEAGWLPLSPAPLIFSHHVEKSGTPPNPFL